jgi:hypothetical protein
MEVEQDTQGGNAPPDQSEAIRAAIAESIEKSGYDPTNVADDSEWDNAGLDSVEDGGTSSTVDSSSTEGDTSEATSTEDVPDVYWGVDLSDIPVEKRAEVIAHFEQQDSTIRKLQERLSTPEEPTPPADADSVEVEEVSDEDLLRAAGFDPEDYEVQQNAKFLLPSLRSQLALEDQVATLQRQVAGREAETAWNRELDELEASYGKLPGDRTRILQEAVKQGFGTPFETYFRLSAGPRREVETAVAEARREAAKREQGASPKPRGGDIEPPPIEKGESLRDAVAKAMKGASQKTGLSWKKAVKGSYTDSLLER